MKRCILVLAIILSMTFSIHSITLAQPSETTVEGLGYYYNTGESYASDIKIIGFNSRDNIMYINIDFETTSVVAVGETVTFNYYIEVFDDSGNALGNIGTYDVPETLTGLADASTASESNIIVPILPSLTSSYRIVVTVKSTDIV